MAWATARRRLRSRRRSTPPSTSPSRSEDKRHVRQNICDCFLLESPEHPREGDHEWRHHLESARLSEHSSEQSHGGEHWAASWHPSWSPNTDSINPPGHNGERSGQPNSSEPVCAHVQSSHLEADRGHRLGTHWIFYSFSPKMFRVKPDWGESERWRWRLAPELQPGVSPGGVCLRLRLCRLCIKG